MPEERLQKIISQAGVASRRAAEQMILDGRGQIEDAPHVALIPAGIMFVTVLCFNLLGDQFRQIFNVRDAAL